MFCRRRFETRVASLLPAIFGLQHQEAQDSVTTLQQQPAAAAVIVAAVVAVAKKQRQREVKPAAAAPRAKPPSPSFCTFEPSSSLTL